MESDFITSALMMEERFSQNVLEIKMPKVYNFGLRDPGQGVLYVLKEKIFSPLECRITNPKPTSPICFQLLIIMLRCTNSHDKKIWRNYTFIWDA